MDPLTRTALAVHGAGNKYAVLLGSGISRAAQVKTGWEVTLDLVTQLAVAQGRDAPDDPAAWYHDQHGHDPDYSQILEELAPTPALRRERLHGYFEPTDPERDEGIKVPTAAHRALAELVAGGAIRIIVTTNFDKLTEQALDAADVPHDVWPSADAVTGGVPISHGQVVVVKLHGDYRDTRLLNTTGELDTYDPVVDRLLDQILDEFGLIVCGWSGEWDAALRAAILRAPGRRFPTFWTAHGGHVVDAAQPLVDHRDATVVPIDDADAFFSELRDKVLALQEYDAPGPDSVQVAVATMKRQLPDPDNRLRLIDTVMGQARQLHERTGPEAYPVGGQNPTIAALVDRAQRYEADSTIMVHVLAHLAAHGDRPDHTTLATRALELIANPDGAWGGTTVLLHMRGYPALLGMYASGVAAVATGNWPLLPAVLLDPWWHHPNASERLAPAVHPWRVFDGLPQVTNTLAAGNPDARRYAPISDHLHDLLEDALRPIVDTGQRYTEAFDRFEYLVGLATTHLKQIAIPGTPPWIPDGHVGSFGWRYRHDPDLPPATWAQRHADELAPVLMPDTDDPATAWTTAVEAYQRRIQEVTKTWH